jgi:DNA topoisomerase-6 subunit B
MLAGHIRKKQHADYQAQRRGIFELYIEEVAQSLGKITGKSPQPIKREFMRVAEKVTEADAERITEAQAERVSDADMEEQDKKLSPAPEAIEKPTRRPRRSEEEGE